MIVLETNVVSAPLDTGAFEICGVPVINPWALP